MASRKLSATLRCRKTHFREKGLVTKIVAQTAQQRIYQQAEHPGVAIIKRDLQPLEGFVFLATYGVNLSDLIRKTLPSLGNQLGQGRVGCLTISDHILRDREFETAITFVGFQSSFRQGRLTVTALGSNEYLPSMIASTGGLQFSGLACSRVCLIQFSGIEKNARQIALGYSG